MNRRTFIRGIPRVLAAIGLTPLISGSVRGAWSDLRPDTSTTSSSPATTHSTRSRPITIVNVIDQKELDRYLKSRHGRKAILRTLEQHRRQTIREVLQ